MNLRELLNGDSTRLRYVYRYSTCRSNKTETVAEHSYYTVLYTLLIGTWLRAQGVSFNLELALSRAIVHDLEEARTGDMPRFFKHAEEETRVRLDDLGFKAFGVVVGAVFDEPRGAAPIKTGLKALWKFAKDTDSVEGCLVAFADFLSVLSYLEEEAASGNLKLSEHVQGIQDYYNNFLHVEFNFLGDLVQQAGVLLRSWEARVNA